jgi:hypothetical protein
MRIPRLKVSVVSSALAVLAAGWAKLQFIFDAFQLRANTGSVWQALMDAPKLVPWLLVAFFLVAFVWSLRPPKQRPPALDHPEPNPPEEWIPFHRALYYLVYESAWGAAQPPVSGEAEFNQVVSAEVRERLARGDIAVRGKLGWDRASQRATEVIPASYWVDAFFLPFGTIALGRDDNGAVCKQGGGGATYQAIVLNQRDIRRGWPPSRTTGLTALASLVEETRAKCAEGNAELERRKAKSFPAPSFTERHREIVQSLAEPLSRLERVALDRAAWTAQWGAERLQASFAAFTDAKETAESLIAQIPYDPSTVQTIRDFIRACEIVIEITRQDEDDRDARKEVHRISPGLFRFLHQGRSVDRAQVDLPDWCRTGPEQTYEEAFQEAASDWMPFVRLRELAPQWGIPLPRTGPGLNNAYHLEGALRQAAVRGQLRVEGRQYCGPVRHNDPLVPIPPEHFRDYGFGHGILNYEEPNEASHTGDVRMMTLGQRGRPDVTFYDLHLHRDEARTVVKTFAADPKIERP